MGFIRLMNKQYPPMRLVCKSASKNTSSLTMHRTNLFKKKKEIVNVGKLCKYYLENMVWTVEIQCTCLENQSTLLSTKHVKKSGSAQRNWDYRSLHWNFSLCWIFCKCCFLKTSTVWFKYELLIF